jgi:hypothetical protein
VFSAVKVAADCGNKWKHNEVQTLCVSVQTVRTGARHTAAKHTKSIAQFSNTHYSSSVYCVPLSASFRERVFYLKHSDWGGGAPASASSQFNIIKTGWNGFKLELSHPGAFLDVQIVSTSSDRYFGVGLFYY